MQPERFESKPSSTGTRPLWLPPPDDSCAVFYYDYLPGKMEDARHHSAVFDASLTRQWTKDIPSTTAGRSGMSWYLVASRDGYLAGGTALNGDLFLARYSWSGELRWIETLRLSCRLSFVLPSADGFYLIGETETSKGPPTSFRVVRVRDMKSRPTKVKSAKSSRCMRTQTPRLSWLTMARHACKYSSPSNRSYNRNSLNMAYPQRMKHMSKRMTSVDHTLAVWDPEEINK